MEENKKEECEEINLTDYIKVIIKRKKMILVIFLLAMLVAAIYSFLAPKVYKIDTSLEVGKVENTGSLVELPEQVVAKIDNDVYGVNIRKDLNISEEGYPKIKSENEKDTSLINIEIESSDVSRAKNILEMMNDLIINEHQEKIKIKFLRKGLMREHKN